MYSVSKVESDPQTRVELALQCLRITKRLKERRAKQLYNMPPTIVPVLGKALIDVPASRGIAPFLLPFLHTQQRAASILSSLSDNQSAYKKRIRRGRGPASGKGKTAGRGYNGQKQKGKVPRGFNGGQTTLEVYKGLRGFKNV